MKLESQAQVLIVEDNSADVQLIKLCLKKLPELQVATVTNGEEATRYLFERVPAGLAKLPDFIILDLNLPRKDGREVLREIRDAKETSGMPVVIFSTSKNEADVRTCYELHANCFVTKPADLTGFERVIRRIEEFWCRTVELPKFRTAH